MNYQEVAKKIVELSDTMSVSMVFCPFRVLGAINNEMKIFDWEDIEKIEQYIAFYNE